MCWCDSTGLKIYGAGQWLEEKRDATSRRGWRKLHLAVDADSGEIIAHSLIDQETGDAAQLEPLLDQIEDEIDQFNADGPYDGTQIYDAVLRHSQAQGSSFHHARTRLNGPTPTHAGRETVT